MKIKPILFGTPMVQGILEDRKNQTRRTQGLKIINENPDDWENIFQDKDGNWFASTESAEGDCLYPVECPKQIGDILWVRETFEIVPIETASVYTADSNVQKKLRYKADGEDSFEKWKPSIFMPKSACRIFLKVTNVRVERLNDITEEDAISEGIIKHSDYGSTGYILYTEPEAAYTDIDAVYSFESLWESINGKESWEANPWVWVYDFKRVDKPENF